MIGRSTAQTAAMVDRDVRYQDGFRVKTDVRAPLRPRADVRFCNFMILSEPHANLRKLHTNRNVFPTDRNLFPTNRNLFPTNRNLFPTNR